MSMEYEVSGERDQVLQVVLRSNEHLHADCHTLCWSSDNIKFRRLDSAFSILMGSRSDGIQIVNSSSTPGFVGLSQRQGGPILVLKFEQSHTTGIFCFRESFICASPRTAVVAKRLPLASTSNTSYGVSSQRRFLVNHCSVDKSSVIFLQNGADIMHKNLCIGDSIHINMWCCVAIEDTCTVRLNQIHQLYFGGYFAREGIMIIVEGPGRVYFSANKESASANGLITSSGFGRGGSSPSMMTIILNFLAMLLTIYMIILLSSSLFLDSAILDELEKMLEQVARQREDREEL